MDSYIRIPWRLERIPSNSYTKKIAFILGLCFFFEWVDNGSISYFLPVFGAEFSLTKDVLGVIGTASNIGVMIGTLISGIASDRVGRKKVIIASMILWGIAGLAQAFTHTLPALMVTRVVMGLGIGIQLPATITLVSESIPSRLRAKYVVIMLAMAPLGSTIAGILCYYMIPTVGWRGVAIVEAVPALMAFVIWKLIPESALWHEAKGHIDEANRIMTEMENKIKAAINQELPPVTIVEQKGQAKAPAKSNAKLFSKKFLKTNIMITVWWPATMIAAYGMSTWFTSIFVDKGISLSSSILYTSLITLGGVGGVFVLPKLLDVVGRRWSCVIIGLIAACAAFAYGSVEAIVLLIICGMLFQFGAQGVAQVSVTYASELYPTSIRNTGVGYAQFIGRLGSVLGPIILGLVMSRFSISAAVYFAAAMYIIGGAFVLIFGEETKGKVFTDE